MRSPRARERLTEVQPLLVAALADTADPDRALASFDRFIAELPAGVQLFSLLRANPAPAAAARRHHGHGAAPVAHPVPPPAAARCRARPAHARHAADGGGARPLIAARDRRGEHDIQYVLDRARVIGSEQQFLIGVRVLSGAIKANQAGGAYALLAERLIDALRARVEHELVRAHGRVPGGGAAVLAMGKLGGREMTASSDLDLILIYDFDDAATQSDGARPAGADALLCAPDATPHQRAVGGRPPRARCTRSTCGCGPPGSRGRSPRSSRRFVDYQTTDGLDLGAHGADARPRHLPGRRGCALASRRRCAPRSCWPRDRAKIAADVLDMRERIAKEKGTDDIWDLKQVRGGLVDVEFIAQYLQLVHAAAHPEVLDQNTVEAFRKLRDAGLLAQAARRRPDPGDAAAARPDPDPAPVHRGPLRPGDGAVGPQGAARPGGRCAELCASWRPVCGRTWTPSAACSSRLSPETGPDSRAHRPATEFAHARRSPLQRALNGLSARRQGRRTAPSGAKVESGSVRWPCRG